MLWITDNQNVAKNGFFGTLCQVPKKTNILFSYSFPREGSKYFRRGETFGLQESKHYQLSKIPIIK